MRARLIHAFGHLIGGVGVVAIGAGSLAVLLAIFGFWCHLMTRIFMFGWRAFPY